VSIRPRLPRPASVTIAGWLFVLSGLVGVAYHATKLRTSALDPDAVWIIVVRLLAVLSGVYILRGASWAAWLAIAWLAYHVILSALHSISETVMHIVLLAAVAYALLRPPAGAYFRGV
jgi:hypothetical protein